MQQRHSMANKSASDSSASEDNIKEIKQNNNKSARHTIAAITNKQKLNENEMPPPIHPAPKAAKKQQQQTKSLNNNFNVNQMSLQSDVYQPTQEIPQQNTFGNYIENTSSLTNATATYNRPAITPLVNGLSAAEHLSNAQIDEIETTIPHFNVYNPHYNNYKNTNNNRHVTTTTCIDQFDLEPTTTTTQTATMNAANTQQQQQQQQNSALTKPKRLSPLSNSGILTTSYTQEQTPSVKYDTDEEIEFENSEEFSESEIEFEYDDDDEDDGDVDIDEIETISAGHRKINDKHFFPNVSTTTTNTITNNNTNNTNKLYPNLNALTNDNLNLNTNTNFNTKLSYTPTQFTKYKPKRHTTHNSSAKTYAVNNDEVDKLIETPFLSEFAKKLETLKAEKLTPTPLPKNVITKRNLNVGYLNEMEVIKPTNYKQIYEKPKPRPALETTNNKNIFNLYFESLNEKYQIKYYLTAIMIFVLLVFIYVFFFQ